MRLTKLVYCTLVAFWASVPLFAVWLAVTPRDGRLGLPGMVLWCVVVASSAFLTAREYRLMPRDGGESPIEARRRLEAVVYPIVLLLACFLPALQIGYF